MHEVNANGVKIPGIGMGTWTLEGDQARNLVAKALEVGYRHIDTAAMYKNENAVGAGLKDSGMARDDYFLTTKVWPSDAAPDDFIASAEASLDRLGTDHVDLILIHWPSKTVPFAETIAALNEVHAKGWAKAIGISNFTIDQIEEVVALPGAPLACNQIEYHPLLNQTRVIETCRKHGLAVTSYCPLARGGDLFSNPAVTGPSARTGATAAQVVLRWHVQQDGVIAIPRTSNPDRLAENLSIDGFELTAEEMAAISALRSAGHRICDFEFSPVWDAT